MNAVLGFFRSTIGKKIIMALSGIVLFGYVVAHMLGNLQVYMGPEALNAYGAFLHHFGHGGGIWVARAVLLVCVGLHVWSATALTLANWSARPQGYRETRWQESTYAGRTMRWSGVILLLFIVYHLLHFTTGTFLPGFVPGDVYHNYVMGFRQYGASAFYIVAMLCLGLHMYHGVWSMLQTLGLSHPRYNHLRLAFATFIAAIVVIGNISFPVAVMAGWIDEAPRAAITASNSR